MKIYGITGASGYVGSVISHFINSKGEEIIEIGRTPSSPNVKFIHYQLGGPIQQKELSNIDVLIHCAYDMKLRKKKIFKESIFRVQFLFCALCTRQR